MICGKLEIDILHAFWVLESSENDALSDEKDISIQDVVDELAAQGVERAYTTIKTVMDRLVAKSVLVRYKLGNKFFYKSVMSRTEMSLESIHNLVDQFFDGDYLNLVKFVESECAQLV